MTNLLLQLWQGAGVAGSEAPRTPSKLFLNDCALNGLYRRNFARLLLVMEFSLSVNVRCSPSG